ncbi:MAG: Beta-galactosidase C-terminal domain, partial [Alphaproteobacteria bacterium]|nr:Beta-galactosidase C-terminal domain [Alphaproteobacteria bacterium]
IEGKVAGLAQRWVEHIETKAKVISHFADGRAAFVASGRNHYLAFWPEPKMLERLVAYAVKQAGLKSIKLPPNIRLRRRGNLQFAMNYGPEPWTLPKSAQRLLGGPALKAYDIAVWKVD